MYSDDAHTWGCKKEEKMTKQKCTCQKVPELNYVSSDPDCPVHYPDIYQEEEWEEEFEKVWKDEPAPMGDVPPILMNALRRIGLKYWLESRRRFITQLRKDAKLVGFDVEEWEEKEVEG